MIFSYGEGQLIATVDWSYGEQHKAEKRNLDLFPCPTSFDITPSRSAVRPERTFSFRSELGSLGPGTSHPALSCCERQLSFLENAYSLPLWKTLHEGINLRTFLQIRVNYVNSTTLNAYRERICSGLASVPKDCFITRRSALGQRTSFDFRDKDVLL